VFVGVRLAGFLGMMHGMHVMPVRDVGMVARGFVVAGFMVLCRFAVVLGTVVGHVTETSSQ
jgi:hypothetical protein